MKTEKELNYDILKTTRTIAENILNFQNILKKYQSEFSTLEIQKLTI